MLIRRDRERTDTVQIVTTYEGGRLARADEYGADGDLVVVYRYQYAADGDLERYTIEYHLDDEPGADFTDESRFSRDAAGNLVRIDLYRDDAPVLHRLRGG